MKRIAVHFQDGSLMTLATRKTEAEQMEEARDVLEGANRGVKPGKPKASIVLVDVAAVESFECEHCPPAGFPPVDKPRCANCPRRSLDAGVTV